MKQLLLILAFLLPVCAFSQLQEPFDGPEITSANPWRGDLDCFVIDNGWLVSCADPARGSVSLEIPITYSATMQWELCVGMDFIPSDRNHVRFHVFQDNQSISGLKADYYIQIGSNKKTITLRRQVETEKKPKVLIEKVLEDLTKEVTMQIKLTLNVRIGVCMFLNLMVMVMS